MAGTTELIKFEVCLYKKDDMPYDDFVKWCTENYPPKAIPIMKKHNIIKWTEVSRVSSKPCRGPEITSPWTQTITPPHFREFTRNILHTELNRPKWTVPDYDIVMTYWVRSMDDMTALTTDPDWVELEKEATTISDPSIGHIIVGHEFVQIDASSSSTSSRD